MSRDGDGAWSESDRRTASRESLCIVRFCIIEDRIPACFLFLSERLAKTAIHVLMLQQCQTISFHCKPSLILIQVRPISPVHISQHHPLTTTQAQNSRNIPDPRALHRLQHIIRQVPLHLDGIHARHIALQALPLGHPRAGRVAEGDQALEDLGCAFADRVVAAD